MIPVPASRGPKAEAREPPVRDAADVRPAPGCIGRPVFARRFVASDAETRATSALVVAALAGAGLDAEELGAVELVLVEALNNIVEHAYPAAGGPVEVSVALTGDTVVLDILDWGCALPGGRLPDPGPPWPASLPEGGFGWHLIRCLTDALEHVRRDDRNRLRMVVAVAPRC